MRTPKLHTQDILSKFQAKKDMCTLRIMPVNRLATGQKVFKPVMDLPAYVPFS